MKARKLFVFLPAFFSLYLTIQIFYRNWSTPLETIVLAQENQEQIVQPEVAGLDEKPISRISWKRSNNIRANLDLLKKKLLANKQHQQTSKSSLLVEKSTTVSVVQSTVLYSKDYGNSDVTRQPLRSGCDTTLVTSLMDIGRGQWRYYSRPYELYQNFMKPLLQLDVCLYIYTDEAAEPFVRDQRKRFSDKTIIHVLTLKELPYSAYYSQMKRIIDDEQAQWNNEWEPVMRTHPESFSVDYLLLMNSKAYFVKAASDRNPFHSKHFFWLDAGYGHGHTDYPAPGSSWAPSKLFGVAGDKVTFMKLPHVDLSRARLKELYRKDVALIVGSFFGGNKRSIDNYYTIYHNVFMDLLNKRYIDDDQTLTVLCYHSKPEFFNIVDGDWYDVFRLFS